MPSKYAQESPHFARWVNMVQRENNTVRTADMRTRGIIHKVCAEWGRPASTGLKPFNDWVEDYLKKNPLVARDAFQLRRHDDTRPFSPTNCYLLPIKKKVTDPKKPAPKPKVRESERFSGEAVGRMESLFACTYYNTQSTEAVDG